MAVVVFHAGSSFVLAMPSVPEFFKNFLSNGHLGVAFFFVLSGFILQHVYGARLRTRTDLTRYSVARFARIYPIYLVATLAMLPFISVMGWRDAPQFLLIQHWFPAILPQPAEWNLPGWTLSVELFFYLIFPFLTVPWSRLTPSLLWAILLCLSLVTVVTESASYVTPRQASGWLVYLPVPVARLPEFLIGMTIGEIHRRDIPLPWLIPGWVIAAALMAILGSFSGHALSGYVVALSAMLILVLARRPDDFLARVLSAKILVLLGGASYALYLLHMPINTMLDLAAGGNRLILLSQYPLAILVSIAAFLWLEEPAREWLRTHAGMAPSANKRIADRAIRES